MSIFRRSHVDVATEPRVPIVGNRYRVPTPEPSRAANAVNAHVAAERLHAALKSSRGSQAVLRAEREARRA